MMTKLSARSHQRVLLGSLTLLAALGGGCRDNSPPPAAAPAIPLNLYVVRAAPAGGLRPVSLPPSDAKGYIAGQPDFVLNRLAAAVPTVSQSVTAISSDVPGLQGSKVQNEQTAPVMILTLHGDDVPAFAAFLAKNEGQSVLFMMGDKPIGAPQPLQSFTDMHLQIAPDASVDRQQLEKDLKELVR